MFESPAVAVAPVAADVRRRIRAVRLVTSAATAMAANRLNPGRDGIGDVEHIAILTGKTVAAFAEREAAQTGPAHLTLAELRERRRVGTRHIVAAKRIRRAFEERHHRPTLVVGLLNEDFAETVRHQAPDVARSPADDFEPLSVRRETCQLRFVELGDVARFSFDL